MSQKQRSLPGSWVWEARKWGGHWLQVWLDPGLKQCCHLLSLGFAGQEKHPGCGGASLSTVSPQEDPTSPVWVTWGEGEAGLRDWCLECDPRCSKERGGWRSQVSAQVGARTPP